MKYKIIKFSIFVLITFLFTGCSRMNSDSQIYNNVAVDFEDNTGHKIRFTPIRKNQLILNCKNLKMYGDNVITPTISIDIDAISENGRIIRYEKYVELYYYDSDKNDRWVVGKVVGQIPLKQGDKIIFDGNDKNLFELSGRKCILKKVNKNYQCNDM